ncbi:NUDIX hydrolase [Limnoglobus roseus]|uniref:NUDIX domain-containing protein n=1 Tax=Limnoglobus roseus TaxID=2598579 RepID=A0A5C1A729_9BACT|nr:NUDIX domain-containing protein [Limnoglobus roseus]QEL14520.1 NUDIX domain-containing protein [Limnoglobus roseus]
MLPSEHFRHCPRCGTALPFPGAIPLRCPACQFTYYFNPTLAAAAFIQRPDGKYVFIRRERDPGKGKLTVPGGFVDIGETAEEALVREVEEEVGLTIADIEYVCSLTNRYLYKDVTYPVCDLMFRAVAVNPDAAIVGDGATAVEWWSLEDLNPNELAFPSVRRGRELLLG